MRNVRTIVAAMSEIACDRRQKAILRIEASRIVLATKGVLVPTLGESAIQSAKGMAEYRLAQEEILKRVGARQERKRLKNKIQYLERKRKAQKPQPVTGGPDANTIAD